MKLFENLKKHQWIITEAIMVGILGSVFIASFFVWGEIKSFNNKLANTLELPGTAIDMMNGDNDQVDINACDKNTIKDFGEVKEGTDIFVYTTRCFLDVTPLNASTIFYQFYARDFGGTFNKEIYNVLNTPDFDGGSGVVISDPHKNFIGIYRINENGETIVIDSFGNKISEEAPDYRKNVYESPDKNITVSIDYPELRGNTSLTIVNNESGAKYFFDDFKQSLHGIRHGAWSVDGKTLYITGGIYEFSAPARLWSIDVDSGKISEYDNLDGYFYPVYIFPEENIAYFTDAEANFESENREISLYKMDLASRKIEKVYTDKATWTFNNLKVIDGSLYYRAFYEDKGQVIVKLSGKQKEIFLENVTDLKVGTGPRFVATVDNGYFVFDLEKGISQLIEVPTRYDGLPIIDKTEYFQNIDGIIETY